MYSPSLRRFCGFCGLGAPLLAGFAIWRAISLAPSFSWQHNWLSDLGVMDGPAIWFNTGLVLAGIGFLFLLAGMQDYLPARRAYRTSLIILGASAVSLMGVGVFSEDAGRIHYYVSVLFFSLAGIGFIALGISEWAAGVRTRGFAIAALGAGVAVSWAIPWPGTAGALPEAASAVCIGAAAMVYGALLVGSVCPVKARRSS